MNEWVWVWLGLAVIFTVAEVIEGGGFTGPWALGAGAAACLEWFSAPISWQWTAFVGLSSVVFVVWRRAAHPVAPSMHSRSRRDENAAIAAQEHPPTG